MGRVNSPGAGKITDEALLSHTNPLIGISFFLVIGKEGAWVCYRKGRQRHRMAKRGQERNGKSSRMTSLLLKRRAPKRPVIL